MSKGKAGKRGRASPHKPLNPTPTSSPGPKAPKSLRLGETPMTDQVMTDAGPSGSDQAILAQLQQEVKELKSRVTNVEKENQGLRTVNTKLTQEVTQLREEKKKLSEENEKLHQARNRNRVSIKGVPAGTTAEAVKAKVVEVSDGLLPSSVLDVYQSGPCHIVVFDTLGSAIKALKAQNKLYKACQWRTDRALTKLQRQQRAAQGQQYLELREAGAFPRFHGTTLMVRMTTGVKPASEWNPQLKLPPRQQQQQQNNPRTFAQAAAGGNRNANGQGTTSGGPPGSAGPRA